ncbi:MAG: family 43 glycosylhydrolase, partial [Candidatus Hydrogenedentota bacterium]
LDRTTDATGQASELTLEELQELDAGSWFDEAYAGERIPSLAEALEWADSDTALLLDLKDSGDTFADAVAADVEEHGRQEDVVIGVRSAEQARRFRERLPECRQLAFMSSPNEIEAFAEAEVDVLRLWLSWLEHSPELADEVRQTGAKLMINGATGEREEAEAILAFEPDWILIDDPAQLFESLAALSETSSAFNDPAMLYTDDDLGYDFAKDPTVVHFGDTYFLYYSIAPPGEDAERANGFGIGIATSDNLVDWQKAGEIVWNDGAEVNGYAAPNAIVLDDTVHLFYQSYGNGPRDAICHAWSEDGVNFTRNDNPVFRPDPYDSEGEQWNSGRAIDASVVVLDDELYLYWATRDPEHEIQMQGVSRAPLETDFGPDAWTQISTEGPILKPELPWERSCIEAAAIAKHDDKLYMFYGGAYNHERQQIGVAISEEGIDFTRLFVDEPFKSYGPPGTWYSYEVGHPFFFRDEDGQGYLFYQGRAIAEDDGEGEPTPSNEYYLSMSPVRWEPCPDGGPDLPVLAPELLEAP